MLVRYKRKRDKRYRDLDADQIKNIRVVQSGVKDAQGFLNTTWAVQKKLTQEASKASKDLAKKLEQASKTGMTRQSVDTFQKIAETLKKTIDMMDKVAKDSRKAKGMLAKAMHSTGFKELLKTSNAQANTKQAQQRYEKKKQLT